MTSAELCVLLRTKYPPEQFALLFEVRSCTGAVRSERYADAIAFSLWPSRGLDVLAFEIKVSRGDWMRELSDPSKADEFFRYMDFWWIVAPRGLVKKDELPKRWGLIEPVAGDSKLAVKVQAERLDPLPMPRYMLASMARSVYYTAKDYGLQDIEVSRRVKAESERLTELYRKESEKCRLAVKQAEEKLNLFANAIGESMYSLNRVRPESVREAIALLTGDGGLRNSAIEKLRKDARTYRSLMEDLERRIDCLEKPEIKEPVEKERD